MAVLVRVSFTSDAFCTVALLVVADGGHFIAPSGPNSTEMSCSKAQEAVLCLGEGLRVLQASNGHELRCCGLWCFVVMNGGCVFTQHITGPGAGQTP